MLRQTKRMIAAADKIAKSALCFDISLAGEIPVDNGVLLTDGLALVYSPQSFGLTKCSRSDVGEKLQELLLSAVSSRGEIVEKPFRFEKVASDLGIKITQHERTDRYGESFLDIGEYSFHSGRVLNLFIVTGRKSVGTLARNDELFGGLPYLVVAPIDFSITDDIYGLLLPYGKVGT